MKKMILKLRPFSLDQDIYVYQDGKILYKYQLTFAEMDSKLFELLKKEDIQHIDLTGSKQYTIKLKQELEKINMSKYHFNNLIINII